MEHIVGDVYRDEHHRLFIKEGKDYVEFSRRPYAIADQLHNSLNYLSRTVESLESEVRQLGEENQGLRDYVIEHILNPLLPIEVKKKEPLP